MRSVMILIACACILNISAYSQQAQGNAKVSLVAEELTVLFDELNKSVANHDKEALERIYADDFLFIHAFGYIVNKADQIKFFMESDSVSLIPTPSFDRLYVSGDLAIVRMLYKIPVVDGVTLMSTSIYKKNDGRWQIFQVQSTQQQKERQLVRVDKQTLFSYTGRYTDGKNYIVVTTDNQSLIVQRTGRPKQTLASTSEKEFFDKIGSSYTFYEGSKGNAIHFVWRSPNGQEIIWTKENY